MGRMLGQLLARGTSQLSSEIPETSSERVGQTLTFLLWSDSRLTQAAGVITAKGDVAS